MTITTPMPASPCTRRRFLKHSAAASAAVLGGALRPQPAAAAFSQVVRVGFIAHLGSTQGPPQAPAVLEVAGYAGWLGARAGAEEMGANARLLGREFELKMAAATTPAAAVREARRLAASEKVFAIAGGYDTDVALALSEFAEQSRLVFFNVGATSDALRNESCRRYTFHIEASDAMYLDAIVDWFTRGLAFLVDEDAPEGVRIVRRTPTRRWFLVSADSPAWQARRRRTHAALERRHWGGRVVGDAVVDPDSAHARDTLSAIEQAHPDLVFLLLGPQAQLAFLRQLRNAALRVEVSGFPEPLTQTRAFLAALLDAAPSPANESIRAVLWDAAAKRYRGFHGTAGWALHMVLRSPDPRHLGHVGSVRGERERPCTERDDQVAAAARAAGVRREYSRQEGSTWVRRCAGPGRLARR